MRKIKGDIVTNDDKIKIISDAIMTQVRLWSNEPLEDGTFDDVAAQVVKDLEK